MKPTIIIFPIQAVLQELELALEPVLSYGHQVMLNSTSQQREWVTKERLMQYWVKDRLEEFCLLLVEPWLHNKLEIPKPYVQRLWCIPDHIDNLFYRQVRVPPWFADRYLTFEIQGRDLYLYYR